MRHRLGLTSVEVLSEDSERSGHRPANRPAESVENDPNQSFNEQ
jgi:hypothetical protein